MDPNNVAAYKVLGNLYAKQGKQAESDKAFESAMHANGRLAAVQPAVERVLQRTGMSRLFPMDLTADVAADHLRSE